MNWIDDQDGSQRARGTLVARRPRESDAVGGALRNAFGDAHTFPREWRVALERLDRVH